jgi:hypothetical protein
MTTATATAKKVTLATIKSFVKKNAGKLLISTGSRFDGSVDCVMPCADKSFTPVIMNDDGEYMMKATLGIQGAWFVRDSRDYFTPFEKDGLVGYEVYNSCGCFSLAVKV